MTPRIKTLKPLEEYKLDVVFDDGKHVVYDVMDDIKTIPSYGKLKTDLKLFKNVFLDKSRTVVIFNEQIDIPSDAIYEYGVAL